VSKGTIKVTVGIPTYNRSMWLQEAIKSVLAQSYEDFRLLICDNASEDETPDVVKSFGDSRIDYQRSSRNVGMIENFNRVMTSGESDFLVVLPDDDALHPEYLRSTVNLLEDHPSVGVVHTGYDLIDQASNVLQSGRVLPELKGRDGFESREEFIERSMRSLGGAVCWTSALFRTPAIVEAGGMRENDRPYADFPLLMRIALRWDFFSLAEPLVRLRVHDASETAAQGSLVGDDYFVPELPRILFDHRMRFLQTAGLESKRERRYRALAERAYLEGSVRIAAVGVTQGAAGTSTTVKLLRLVRRHPRTLTLSSTWRLIGGQLGGRRVKRIARRVLGRGT
jgi:glycosyltransferase involved in cell wall biosynthesis